MRGEIFVYRYIKRLKGFGSIEHQEVVGGREQRFEPPGRFRVFFFEALQRIEQIVVVLIAALAFGKIIQPFRIRF